MRERRRKRKGVCCLPNGVDEDVDEEEELVRGDNLTVSDHLVVGALHEALLQLNSVLDVEVLVNELRVNELELSVELGDPVLGEQPHQVQAQEHVHLLRLGQFLTEIGIVTFKLGHIALEGGNVHGADAPEGPILEELPCSNKRKEKKRRKKKGKKKDKN